MLNTAKLSTNSSTAFGAAIALAQHGLAVFPVLNKRPLTPHGVYSASSDPKVFCGFDWHCTDCAVATGAASGIDVLDVDVREEGNAQLQEDQGNSPPCPSLVLPVNGFVTLAALGTLPETLAARTPSGGRHYWFRHIDGSRSRKLGDGVEWFSEKKLVVVPPAQGRAWLNDAPIAEAPDWLRQLVLAPASQAHEGKGRNSSGPLVVGPNAETAVGAQVPKSIYSLILGLMRGATPREQRRARALYNVVAGKRCGRNDALNYAAYCFRELSIPREGAAKLLVLAAKANGYLAKDGEEAVRATIMSGLGLKEWPDVAT